MCVCVCVRLQLFSLGKFPLLQTRNPVKYEAAVGGRGAGTHQLLQLPLSVAQLLVHAKANLSALQRGDDLQLRVVVLDDVVLQHQTQDLGGTEQRGKPLLVPHWGTVHKHSHVQCQGRKRMGVNS